MLTKWKWIKPSVSSEYSLQRWSKKNELRLVRHPIPLILLGWSQQDCSTWLRRMETRKCDGWTTAWLKKILYKSMTWWQSPPIPPWHPSFTFTISSALTLENHESLCNVMSKSANTFKRAWQGFVSMSPKWWTTYAESEANEKQSTCCVSISPFH